MEKRNYEVAYVRRQACIANPCIHFNSIHHQDTSLIPSLPLHYDDKLEEFLVCHYIPYDIEKPWTFFKTAIFQSTEGIMDVSI